MIDRNVFSERFGVLRNDSKVTMVDIAKALDISKQSVHQWTNGKNIPASDTLLALADYFQVSLDFLTGRTDNPEINQ